jgi:polar amino acid transport system substrate-binding protein
MFRKFFAVLFISTLFALSFAPVVSAASLADKETIIVGTEGTYPPYEYYDEAGKLVGFDIDLVAELGAKLGKKMQVVDMAFDGLVPALVTGKIDLIAAALNATEERRKVVDFTDVYANSDAAALVKKNNKNIKSLADFNGKTVGVQLGTVEDLYLTNLKDANITIKRYQRTDDAVRDVLLDRLDAVFVGTLVAKVYEGKFSQDAGIVFKQQIYGDEEGFSVALRQNDPVFLDALNAAIRELVSSGRIDELKDKHGL